MAQVNNNAESLSRELRKFKNLKSVDFKGLLSGTPESYVNLYRYLFCENNIGFSQLVLDKGYDLSGLNDYKFMEAIYRLMRDFFNVKPPINQNQFFSPGFTQRKLEMSTIIAIEVRRMTNEITNIKHGKKSVQTQSLMKSSLKRPNSAPRAARVTEMGDESDNNIKNRIPFEKYKPTKSTNKCADKNSSEKMKTCLDYSVNSQSSDELTDESVSSQPHMTEYNKINRDEGRAWPMVVEADTAARYHTQSRTNEHVTKNTYDGRSKPLMDGQAYTSSFNHQKPTELSDVSAFETPTNSNERYNSYNLRNNNQDRMYDVKQYVPSSHTESMATDKDQRLPGLEKIMQQFDTVLARITLLEGRMQRIEYKLDNQSNGTSDRITTPSLYQNQGNINNSEYISSYEHNHFKPTAYSNKTTTISKGTRDAIPDFESNHQPMPRSKVDSDRSYTSSTYSTNYKSNLSSDNNNNNNNYSGPRYVTNYTNVADKRSLDLSDSSATYNPLPPPPPKSASSSLQQHNASTIMEPYQHSSNTYKTSHAIGQKVSSNGMPPHYPNTTTTRKTDDSSDRGQRYGKQSDEKVISQTDRIASMLSDTQKMLRLSDEEL